MTDLSGKRWQKLLKGHVRARSGQSMVEYTLIAVLVVLAIGTTIVLTKGSIGNVFSNTVYNLMSADTTPYPVLQVTEVNGYATAFAAYQRTPSPYITNTPAAPTCSVGAVTRQWMVPNPAATGVYWTPTPGC